MLTSICVLGQCYVRWIEEIDLSVHINKLHQNESSEDSLAKNRVLFRAFLFFLILSFPAWPLWKLFCTFELVMSFTIIREWMLISEKRATAVEFGSAAAEPVPGDWIWVLPAPCSLSLPFEPHRTLAPSLLSFPFFPLFLFYFISCG